MLVSVCCARSPETEAAARAVVLECAAQFSPRIEAVAQPNSAVPAPAFWTLPAPSASSVRRKPSPNACATPWPTAGLRVSIAVSTNFHTARLKAAAIRGITIIPHGHEAIALAKLPLTALQLPADPAEIFAIWGIRTLGELAALPEST